MRTVIREFVAARRRHGDESDRDMRLAWHVVMLDRQRRVPDLARLMTRRPRGQSLVQQQAALAELSAQYGRPIRRRTWRTMEAHGE
jgi:hypothetical protein